MIGLLINLTLLVVAGTTCRKAGKQGVRVKTLQEEVEELEQELLALQLQFRDLRHEADKKLEVREQKWREGLNELLEKRARMEEALKQELEELRKEVDLAKQLDPSNVQKRIKEIEGQRKSLRKEIAEREEKIVELRKSLNR
ncbi:hypothetical protein FGB62_25g529 [Gracilaria domingensis]|nr:hypothetical protein FGB62_25g529 [Gracilaria domingensis]